MPGIKARLSASAYALGWAAVCHLPEDWAAAAFRAVADIAWRRQGPRVQVLEGNLRRVIGADATGQELRALSRRAMHSYARYWLEIFRLPVMSRERVASETVEAGHVEDVVANLAAGRGVVIAVPHTANWDAAAVWMIARAKTPFTTVMERLEPESVYERFLAFRESLGMEVLPATGGASPFGILARRLRAGKLVILPCDRDVTGSGIEVDFFGQKALMMGGPAALAVQTGAALFPATPWFEERAWGVWMHPEIPVPAEGDRWQKAAAMTQEIARAFERGIRQHPADWHMLQRMFVSDLDPDRLAAARARARARERGAERNSHGGQAAAAAAAAAEKPSGSHEPGARFEPDEVTGGPASSSAADARPDG